MSHRIQQASTASKDDLVFFMVSSTDHVSGKTGLSPVVKLKAPGAAAFSATGAITEIDATNLPGWYKVAANATDNATLGRLILSASVANADNTDMTYEVVVFDPTNPTFNADVVKLNTDATAAANLRRAAQGIIVGQAATGTLSVNQMSTNLSVTHADDYVGRTIVWVTGTLTGVQRRIAAATTGGLFTYATVAAAPANNDYFVIN